MKKERSRVRYIWDSRSKNSPVARSGIVVGHIAIVLGTWVGVSALASPVNAQAPTAIGRRSGAFVIAWNRELLHIVQTPGAQPATIHPTRSFAILHAAIYDAVVSITKDAPTYLVTVKAPHGARPDAAAATAGHDVLLGLYPSMRQSLDDLISAELATIPAGPGRQQGIEVGRAVAAQLLAARANDGSGATPPPFLPGSQPGDYRPTPPRFPAPVFTTWGNVKPFVLTSGAQFRLGPPPALTSQAYADALNEVKSLGQDTSATRTAEQTLTAKFWAGPIWNTWNEIAENAAQAHHTNLQRTARLFAVLNLSLADAAIGMYDAKYHYLLWRPVTAIRLADTDGNPATIPDPTWTPLAVTAADPSYPGAHSTISSAAATVLTAFFGAHDQVHVTSDVLPSAGLRTFASYEAAATEAGLSRIYAGQHTRLDHEAGLALGQNIARFVLQRSALANFDVTVGATYTR
jgi:membrane-associated phospholipid phosphatase